MKAPKRVIFRPYSIYHPRHLDLSQIEDGALLLYIPVWLVRAYRMTSVGSMQGKIWIDITKKHRSLKTLWATKENKALKRYWNETGWRLKRNRIEKKED